MRRLDRGGTSGIKFSAGDSNKITSDKSLLMNSAYQMANQISIDLSLRLGIATDVKATYPVFGDKSAPKKVSIDLADEAKQTASYNDLKTIVEKETRAKLSGRPESEIRTAINSRMATIDKLRNFVIKEIKKGYSVEVQNITGDTHKTQNKTLIGFQTVKGSWTTDIYVNPFTWLKQSGKFLTQSLEGTEPAKTALGPALQLIHEFEHADASFVESPFPTGYDMNPKFSDEEEIVKNVDQYAKELPGVSQRFWYGSGKAVSMGREIPVNQNTPDSVYVLDPSGPNYRLDYTSLAGKQWVKWPSEHVLTKGSD